MVSYAHSKELWKMKLLFVSLIDLIDYRVDLWLADEAIA